MSMAVGAKVVACTADNQAFGGFAGVLPELQHLVDGIELANSLTLDGTSPSCPR
jgi:hypothetical protein